MNTEKSCKSSLHDTRKATATAIIVFALTVLPPRRSHAEDSLGAKFMYYQEDNDRIKVLAPEISAQNETDTGWIIKLDGIYNAISGATPTGAPPAAVAPVSINRPAASSGGGTTSSTPPITVTPVNNGGAEQEHEDDAFIGRRVNYPAARYSAVTAATPAPAPTPAPTPSTPSSAPSAPTSSPAASSGSAAASTTQPAAQPANSSRIPLADFSDTRWAFNIGLSKRMGNHTPSIQASYSQESDYLSTGLSLQDTLDFNKKNTTLAFGGAYTHDALTPANGRPSETKDSIDALLGISQVLTKTTVFTANLTLGQVSGFISDPYKLAEVNGRLIYENRPDSKTKEIIYVGLQQFITPLDASIDLGFRYYTDSFGINAETLSLAWFQKINPHFIISPIIRYYTQTAADFYDVRFSGAPEFYSSDYRISDLTSISYGVKFIWMPTSKLTLDAGVERYEMSGNDGKTDEEMYPTALLFMVGAHVSF
ncbi:MAG: DUF3570 domain-containing protein [bacterium]